MIVVGSECVGCPDEMGCIREACRYYKVARFYCDSCKEETTDLYYFDNEQLCPDCILERLEEVSYDGQEEVVYAFD